MCLDRAETVTGVVSQVWCHSCGVTGVVLQVWCYRCGVTGVVGVTGVGQGAAGVEEGDHGPEPLGAGPGRLPELPLRRLLPDHQGQCPAHVQFTDMLKCRFCVWASTLQSLQVFYVTMLGVFM